MPRPTPFVDLLPPPPPPIAITFVDQPPAGIARIATPEPAGCGDWRRAAAGEIFYTDPEGPVGCPGGPHTHNVPLSPDQARELTGLVETMIGLPYPPPKDVE